MTAQDKHTDLALADEENDWLELPFVRAEGKRVLSNWAPVDIPVDDKKRGYGDQCAVGARYAMELIGFLRRYSALDPSGQCLVDLAKEMVQRGKWTGVEIGFFSALGEYLTDGKIAVAVSFDAKHLND